jgi:hypothetical protein
MTLLARMPAGGWSRIGHPVGIAIALCAIVLRLFPAATPIDPRIGLIALFGEHALCLSDAAGVDQNRVPSEPSPPARDRHEHHAGWCCHSHTTPALILPASAVAVRIFLAIPPDRVAFAAIAPPARRDGSAQPRAPPKQS